MLANWLNQPSFLRAGHRTIIAFFSALALLVALCVYQAWPREDFTTTVDMPQRDGTVIAGGTAFEGSIAGVLPSGNQLWAVSQEHGQDGWIVADEKCDIISSSWHCNYIPLQGHPAESSEFTLKLVLADEKAQEMLGRIAQEDRKVGSALPNGATTLAIRTVMLGNPKTMTGADSGETEVVVSNKVAVGSTLREDHTSAYLSQVATVYCRFNDCVVPGTEHLASGDRLLVHCQIAGDHFTNANEATDLSANPDVVRSNLWYLATTVQGQIGYFPEMFVEKKFRGGLNLPKCSEVK